MTRLDPIIAVKDVMAGAAWYKQIFGFSNAHGGDNFAVLVSEDNQIMLCLHQWQSHDHPTMTNPDIPAGNGLLLYFRTKNISAVYENAVKSGCVIEQDLHRNTNSLHKEFSFRDLDGYFLTISEFHTYQAEPDA